MFFEFFRTVHVRDTMRLAWPLILTQVGHIVTGMVDTIFLGHIGATEQAAGILATNMFFLLLVFTIGVSYATTPLVTQAHENSDVALKASLFKNSLFLNLIVAMVCFVVLFRLSGLLIYLRQPPEVVELAVPFFDVLVFSMIPVSIFFTCKQYCEGLSNTRMALIISLASNLLNIVLNYLLIYGKLGCPEMGYVGAAWASFISRLFMGAAFLIFIFRSPLTREITAAFRKARINVKEIAALWKLGINSAMQFTFEVAAFVSAGLMAGAFGKEHIDAHGIALSIASFTYMFGSGLGSASTIRAGVFTAQRDHRNLRLAASASLKLILVIMGVFSLLLLVFHQLLPLGFTRERDIAGLASRLLLVAAMFQLFDGIQVTIIGLLRGMQDVRIPTLIALVGYWLIALPLAYTLAFYFQLQTIGIWFGLLAALMTVAGMLYWRLNYLLRKKAVMPG